MCTYKCHGVVSHDNITCELPSNKQHCRALRAVSEIELTVCCPLVLSAAVNSTMLNQLATVKPCEMNSPRRSYSQLTLCPHATESCQVVNPGPGDDKRSSQCFTVGSVKRIDQPHPSLTCHKASPEPLSAHSAPPVGSDEELHVFL